MVLKNSVDEFDFYSSGGSQLVFNCYLIDNKLIKTSLMVLGSFSHLNIH
jgi:hypothetical protein